MILACPSTCYGPPPTRAAGRPSPRISSRTSSYLSVTIPCALTALVTCGWPSAVARWSSPVSPLAGGSGLRETLPATTPAPLSPRSPVRSTGSQEKPSSGSSATERGSEGVPGGGGGVGAAGGGAPSQDAGFGLLELPALGLFAPVMMPAQGREVAFAGQAALVPGGGVVQVAADRGTAAAGRGAGGVAGADQVLEGAAGGVAALAVGGVARTAGDEGQRGGEDSRWPGARRSGTRGSGAGWSGAGWSGAGWGVAAGEAGVGGGGAVGVQGGDAPAGAGVAGCGGGQVAGVVAVQDAVPGGFAGGIGAALQGLVRDGDGDQGGQARAGVLTGTGRGTRTTRPLASTVAGSVRAARPGAVRAARSRAVRAVRPGPVRSGADAARAGWVAAGGRLVRVAGGYGVGGEGSGVAFLEEVEVGPDAEFLQGAGDAGGAQVQGALLDVLPGG